MSTVEEEDAEQIFYTIIRHLNVHKRVIYTIREDNADLYMRLASVKIHFLPCHGATPGLTVYCFTDKRDFYNEEREWFNINKLNDET